MAKILVIGAHPDDCDITVGGSAALWRRRGDVVRFVSMTNGNAGHQTLSAAELAARRRQEADRVAQILDIEYEVLENADGELEPTLERRFEMIVSIRKFAPDLILTHRPNDYHPDHRYTSVLVQDSAYMVTVPKVCPEVPHLQVNPVIAYVHDDFQKPIPFEADVAIDVDSVMDLKWSALHAHTSQFYEWLPYNEGVLADVPSGENERLEWLKKTWSPRLVGVAAASRSRLAETYGSERASEIGFAEAYEVSEYGTQPSQDDLKRLFPVS